MMISAYTNYNNNCGITLLHQLVLMGPCNSTRELESSRGETRELEPSKLPVPALAHAILSSLPSKLRIKLLNIKNKEGKTATAISPEIVICHSTLLSQGDIA